MFLARLFCKIPYIRNRMILKIRNTLTEILEDFNAGLFNDKYVKALQSILKSPVIDFNEELVHSSSDTITTFGNSSASSILSIEKKEVKKSVMIKNGLVSSVQKERYFSEWYSNQQSVEALFQLLAYYLEKQVVMLEPVLVNGDKVIDVSLTEDEEAFLDSLLYRLLLTDAVVILDIYLEKQYDKRKQTKKRSFWKK